MRIRFVTPPKERQKGGIENAVEGMRVALESVGETVVDGPDPDDPDAIHHFHGLWDPSHARLASRLRKKKRSYVVSPHGMLEPWAFRNRWWKKQPYFRLVERRFLLGAKCLFVTSSMEKAHLLRIIHHQAIEVLALGCRDVRSPDQHSARQELGWGGRERVMVFLSRVDPKKGLHMLMDALAESGLPVNEWRLVIVGDGPADYVSKLGRQATLLGQRLPRVDWVGPVWGSRRWAYLQAADLFVLPTHSENFGIAVLESMHVGTPVLTTTGTPWAEFRDLDGMFICDPTVSAISSALNEAERRLSAGWTLGDRNKLAKWTTDHFAWSGLVGKYVKAYRNAWVK
jgi:glycosyltransferase involved in cell wall biosynthesis